MKGIFNTRSNTHGLNGVPVDITEISAGRATVRVDQNTDMEAGDKAKLLKGYPATGRKIDFRVADLQEVLGEITFNEPANEIQFPFAAAEAGESEPEPLAD